MNKIALVLLLLLAGVAAASYSLAGMIMQSGSRRVVVPPPSFPVAVAADGRGFVDQDGRATYLKAEAAWSAFVQLTELDWAQYLDDRRAKGFNCVLVNLIEHHFGDDVPAMVDGGLAPFSAADDLRTPVDAYFDEMVERAQAAASRKMCVLLVPIYYGFAAGDEGWYTDAVATRTTGDVQAYCAYVSAKFAALTNVLWVMYGDGFASGAASRYNACAAGIATNHAGMVTAHLAPESYSAESVSQSWLTWNYAYSYGLNNLRAMLAGSYASSPTRPSILGETWYEGEGSQSRLQIRQQAWYAYTLGQAGVVFGNNPIWHFNSPQASTGLGGTWQSNLDSDASEDRARFHDFIDAVDIGYCPPDGGALLTDGVSTGESTATACRTADGTTAVVYTPTQRALTIDWSQMAGAVTARWFNPTTGVYTTATGSPFTNTGSSDVTPPSSGDWVLLLEVE